MDAGIARNAQGARLHIARGRRLSRRRRSLEACEIARTLTRLTLKERQARKRRHATEQPLILRGTSKPVARLRRVPLNAQGR